VPLVPTSNGNPRNPTRSATFHQRIFRRLKGWRHAAADLVIQGTVLTVDALQPTAEAVAVNDGRIVASETGRTIESWIGPETQTIDIATAA